MQVETTQAPSPRAARLSWALKLGYASGQLVEGVVTNTLNIFLLFYVTVVCGLPGGLAGLALSVGLVVDALIDPMIGSISDAWRSPYGRRLPFMLAATAPVLVLFVLIFSLPHDWPPMALLCWLAALSVLLRVALSLFILPYQAVGAEISDVASERSALVAWRWTLGIVGALAAVLLGFGWFFAGPSGLSQASAYRPFAMSLAVLILLGALGAAWAAAATRGRQYVSTAPTQPLVARLRFEVAEVFRNRSFRILFGGALLFFIAYGANASLMLHANTYFWRLAPAQIKLVTLAMFIGLLLGAPLVRPMLARWEKRTVLIVGMLGMALSQGGPAALRLIGWLPLDGAALAWLLAVVICAGSALMAAAAIAFGAMMADAADEHEYLFGQRREGLYFAGWAFASKAAHGGGALIAGLVLQLADFPVTVAGTTAAAPHAGAAVIEVSASTSALIGFFYGPGAALLMLAAVVLSFFYRLDSAAHAGILVELAHRRERHLSTHI